MAHVFLSYASVDRDRARRLAEAMEARGYRVWWDRQIAPGQTFDEVIEKALDDAKCVVVLWSATSVKSDWVKVEAAEAAKRKVLVPALIDAVTIPLEFRRIQAADLTRWDGRTDDAEFNKFLSAVDIEIQTNSEVQRGPEAGPTVASGAAAAPAMAKSREVPVPRPPAPAPRSGVGKWVIAGTLVAAIAIGYGVWSSQSGAILPVAQPKIPEVVGMTYEAAVNALKAAKLAPERREEPSGVYLPGIVIAQSPAAGTAQAATLTTVTLTVAAPPAPVEAAADPPSPAAPETASNPNVKGQTPERAAELLNAAGLKLGVRSDVATNDFELGAIISQDPAAGQDLAKGSAVNITVASRRKVPVLAGLELRQAQAELTRLGLTVQIERVRASRGEKDDQVRTQLPTAGAEIEKGGQAQLTVAVVAPKRVSGGEGLYKTNGQRCLQICKDLGMKFTGQWVGSTSTCTCDLPQN
jgi:beta-lactam-binding protein with PASTA domain